MDPNAVYMNLVDGLRTQQKEMAYEAAVTLLNWVRDRKGFYPTIFGHNTEQVDQNIQLALNNYSNIVSSRSTNNDGS